MNENYDYPPMYTCGAEYICFRAGAGNYKNLAQRPDDISELEWAQIADKIVALLNNAEKLP